MRGKGLIIFFSIALILICVYQLSFNFVTQGIEGKAQSFAEQKVLLGKPMESLVSGSAVQQTIVRDSLTELVRVQKQRYLDSLSDQTVYNLGFAQFNYQQCKDHQLNLGLDLQGGMNVVLQVSIEDLIRNLADNSTDPSFNKALDMASAQQITHPQTDYVSLFYTAYQQINPDGKLASIFATIENKEKIQFNSSNDDVISFIRTESDNAFQNTFRILKTRIDQFGVTQPNITADAASGRIVVELAGVTNPSRVRHLLQATAKLEFWDTYDNFTLYQYLAQADQALGKHLTGKSDSTKTDTSKRNKSALNLLGLNTKPQAKVSTPTKSTGKSTAKSKLDTASLASKNSKTDTSKSNADLARQDPLFMLLHPSIYKDAQGQVQLAPGPVVGQALGKDTAKINEYLSYDFVKSLMPRDARFLWSTPDKTNTNLYYLYAIKVNTSDGKSPLDGSAVTSARQDFDQNQTPDISMNMNDEGAKVWQNMTAKASQDPKNKQSIAIVLDNVVYSAPRVDNEIPGGNSQIMGNFTIDEAKDLANILEAGKLPAPAKIIAEEVVGPSLGQESINNGLRSVMIALGAILLFMILYYANSGIVADIALFFNLFFIIGVLASLNATLTLPGIAGMVLTMGMAVDANVLIHERIKEELARGKGIAKAIADGHTHSYSAVFDTHLTTLITGIILAYFGLGPVLGYATTLNIGIVLTLFTAVFMAHLMYEWMLEREMKITFYGILGKFDFTKYNIQFVSKRKIAYLFSGTLAVIGLISIFTKGFDYGVDFKGGRSYVVRFDHDVNTDDVRNQLTTVFAGEAPEVKTYGTANQVKITSSYLINQNNTKGDSIANVTMFTGLQKFLPPNVTFDVFKSKYQLTSQVVGPTISSDTKLAALKAILFSLCAIFLYILIRFRKWQFALGAIIATVHDVLMVLGIYSLLSKLLPFSLEVDESFVAAALTVMGYSVNDTVIVFDRIREYLREHPASDMKKVINDAINSTLNRTLITSSTVFIVLLILFIFGGDVIRGFAFALLIGVIFGTYSSIFVATPIVVDLGKNMLKNSANDDKTKAAKKPSAV
jgi:SecD/SecF fusion protein